MSTAANPATLSAREIARAIVDARVEFLAANYTDVIGEAVPDDPPYRVTDIEDALRREQPEDYAKDEDPEGHQAYAEALYLLGVEIGRRLGAKGWVS